MARREGGGLCMRLHSKALFFSYILFLLLLHQLKGHCHYLALAFQNA